MIYIEERYLKIVLKILSKYPYKFCAFGSRTKGNPRKYSDLDLCFFENIPPNIREHIAEDFEESDLPFTVDIVDWNGCDQTFKRLIEKDLVCIQDKIL